MTTNLQNSFGNIDIYLFDQLLKGRFEGCRNMLDAGCGSGRNLVYFLQNNIEVFGVDQHVESIEAVKELSLKLAPQHSPDHFIVAPLDRLPFQSDFFDLVISNAVLHFANDQDHFEAMLKSLWRVLKPGGYFFVRLASTIGIEALVVPKGKGRYRLPDGSERFLVSQEMLLNYTDALGGALIEYIKTTNVQNLRAMTTWCLQKK